MRRSDPGMPPALLWLPAGFGWSIVLVGALLMLLGVGDAINMVIGAAIPSALASVGAGLFHREIIRESTEEDNHA